MAATRLARAKVNLFLHVGALQADGYHPLSSLMTFADVGDVVAIEDSAEFGFVVDGPFADALGAAADNLVLKAREAIAKAFRPDWSPFTLTLHKQLPIASGVGGGSADAAAALRLMATRSGRGADLEDETTLLRIASELGSDVPVCLVGEPRLGQGRGDELSLPPAFPDLPAVLVNPLQPSPTGAVYRRYDEAGAPGDAEAPAWPADLAGVKAVARFLAGCRNDLEAPAIALQPAIAEVLAALRSQRETMLARMSGSGATCFAICAGLSERDALAAAIAAAHPDWWVRACLLAGSA
ncbi:MAG TPA: 4-(cytidine 5'-diphospho)-2-C-methyl-D-erythritol kinase [Caulobacteraceae bacterium]|nr:4-(cytidine 5'-diphospho)-2-C-methyl-D-erythritol kinase [Caulobacteraceae bacterium]